MSEPRPTVEPGHLLAGPREPLFAPGDWIGNMDYHVDKVIPGGTSLVYRCWSGSTLRQVALKFPNGGGALLTQEAANWARLEPHPHVVDCLYVGRHEHRSFLVLDWVGGSDVLHHLDASVGDRLGEALRLVSEVCDGLAHIHRHGLVHGDVKPGNLLLDEEARIRITDLGLTAATAGLPAGTPEYAAPELWKGAPPSRAADIYALGCVLYELATDRPAFTGDREDLAKAHGHPPAADPGLPSEVNRLIVDCLARRPRRRPFSVEEVAARIAPFVELRDPPAVSQEFRSRANLHAAAGDLKRALAAQGEEVRTRMRDELTHAGKYVEDRYHQVLALSYLQRGLLLGGAGRWPEGATDFITALRINPELGTAYANLGACCLHLGMPTLALAAMDLAIERDPGDHRLPVLRARLVGEHGWWEEALASCRTAEALAPSDPAVNWALADALFALGRQEEGARHRALSRQVGGDPEDHQTWLLTARKRPHDLTERTNGHISARAGRHEEAVRHYTAALEIAPHRPECLLERAESLLKLGDSDSAERDLRAFVSQVSTTHPRLGKARDLLGEEISFPAAKKADYLRRRIGVGDCTATHMNWAPLTPGERLTLLNMLHAADPGRKLTAVRGLWRACDEARKAYTQTALSRVSEEEYRGGPAGSFATAMHLGDLALHNGLGLPVLLAEVHLIDAPIQELGFGSSPHAPLCWAAGPRAGIWEVIPGTEADRVASDLPIALPVLDEAGSRYLTFSGREVLEVSPTTHEMLDCWQVPQEYGEVVSACFTDSGAIVAGLNDGRVCDREINEVRLADAGAVQLRAAPDGGLLAQCGGDFYRLTDDQVWRGPTGLQPPPLAFTGRYALFAAGSDALTLVHIDRLSEPITLIAPDSVDDRFSAAALDEEGTVVAAICGSFLHLWRRPADAPLQQETFAYLPLTPQPWARCVAVSPAAGFVAVGTVSGSVVIFRME